MVDEKDEQNKSGKVAVLGIERQRANEYVHLSRSRDMDVAT